MPLPGAYDTSLIRLLEKFLNEFNACTSPFRVAVLWFAVIFLKAATNMLATVHPISGSIPIATLGSYLVSAVWSGVVMAVPKSGTEVLKYIFVSWAAGRDLSRDAVVSYPVTTQSGVKPMEFALFIAGNRALALAAISTTFTPAACRAVTSGVKSVVPAGNGSAVIGHAA